MRLANNKWLLKQIKANSNHWFDKGNKRVFGDLGYLAYYGLKTGHPYLVQHTTKNFMNVPDSADIIKSFYIVRKVADNYKVIVGNAIEFTTLADCKEWLRNN